MVKILVKKFDANIKLPSYKTIGSSGMDLLAFLKTPIKLSRGARQIRVGVFFYKKPNAFSHGAQKDLVWGILK